MNIKIIKKLSFKVSMHLKNGLSVVVPIYNEEENISHFFNELFTTLSKQEFLYEIIAIDDGSSDLSLSNLKKLEKKHPNLVVLSHKKNYGQSQAICTGIQQATYNFIATLDGDGQNNPADISLLYKKKDTESVILGNRQKRKDSLNKKVSSYIGNSIRNLIFKDNCKDTGCSLKIFPTEAFLKLPKFNHMHRFLPVLFKKAGYKLINVPVSHRPRIYGQSKYNIKNRLFVGAFDLIGVYWLIKRTNYVSLKK